MFASSSPSSSSRRRQEDVLWNAIQRRLVLRGDLHPSLLGYWARRMLYWVRHPSHAFRFALRMLDQFARGGLTPALAAGLAVTAYGLFQAPPQQQQPASPAVRSEGSRRDREGSGGDTAVEEEKPVIGRLLPVTVDMVRAFFAATPSASLEAFTGSRRQ